MEFAVNIKGLEESERELLEKMDELSQFAPARETLASELKNVRDEIAAAVTRLVPSASQTGLTKGIVRRMARNGMVASIDIVGKPSSTRGGGSPSNYWTKGGKSGITRERTVKQRTQQIRNYTGSDRNFILHIVNSGREMYEATSGGPTGRGSKATYGRRGAIWGHDFMGQAKPKMDRLAQVYGEKIVELAKEKFEE